MAIPREMWKILKIDSSLPKARGFDSLVCSTARKNGFAVGYIEDLMVSHIDTTDGQARKYPEYFKRKKLEEK